MKEPSMGQEEDSYRNKINAKLPSNILSSCTWETCEWTEPKISKLEDMYRNKINGRLK